MFHNFDRGNLVPKQDLNGEWKIWNARLMIYEDYSECFQTYDECWEFIKKIREN